MRLTGGRNLHPPEGRRRVVRTGAPSLRLAIALGLCVGIAAPTYSAIVASPGLRPAAPPRVLLSSPSIGNFTVTVTVMSVNRTDPLRLFAATLSRDFQVIATIDPLSQGFVQSLSYADVDEDARLSPGDAFWVERTDPGAYELVLLWRGAALVNTSWDIARPSVSLAAYTVGNVTWANVTFVGRPYGLADFGAVLIRNGSWWDQMFPLGWGGYSESDHFSFTDQEANGYLTAGDTFRVDTPPASYELLLYWRNTNLTKATWTV